MLRNVCIAALHNAMLCSAMLRQLCFVLVLRYAVLHYGTFVKLCYSTLRYLFFVTLVTLRLLSCDFWLPLLHCITLRRGRLLHYGMRCYVTICYITLPLSVLCFCV